jgi:hypothetical protein
MRLRFGYTALAPRVISYTDRSRGISFFTPTTKNCEFDIMPDVYVADTTKAHRNADACMLEQNEDMDVDVLTVDENDTSKIQSFLYF